MPFGGGARAAQFSRASAQASAAQADLQAVRLAMREVADVDMAEAQSFLRVWHSADDALKAQASALQKIRRGQQLGEISLADVLIAERMVHDALRAEAIARTDAMRALTRIRIDAHELWINDADD
jgi:cobalt-zinc-cadmium efflux system outer membrane protein